jgi:hypothetical protein
MLRSPLLPLLAVVALVAVWSTCIVDAAPTPPVFTPLPKTYDTSRYPVNCSIPGSPSPPTAAQYTCATGYMTSPYYKDNVDKRLWWHQSLYPVAFSATDSQITRQRPNLYNTVGTPNVGNQMLRGYCDATTLALNFSLPSTNKFCRCFGGRTPIDTASERTHWYAPYGGSYCEVHPCFMEPHDETIQDPTIYFNAWPGRSLTNPPYLLPMKIPNADLAGPGMYVNVIAYEGPESPAFDTYDHGQTAYPPYVNYECIDGYKPAEGSSLKRSCSKRNFVKYNNVTGAWDGPMPTCVPKGCDPLPAITAGTTLSGTTVYSNEAERSQPVYNGIPIQGGTPQAGTVSTRAQMAR